MYSTGSFCPLPPWPPLLQSSSILMERNLAHCSPTVFEVENGIWKWFSLGSEFSEKSPYNISNWPQHQRKPVTHMKEQQRTIKDGRMVRCQPDLGTVTIPLPPIP